MENVHEVTNHFLGVWLRIFLCFLQFTFPNFVQYFVITVYGLYLKGHFWGSSENPLAFQWVVVLLCCVSVLNPVVVALQICSLLIPLHPVTQIKMNLNPVVVKFASRVAFPNQHIIDICYHFCWQIHATFQTGEKRTSCFGIKFH